CEVDGDGRVASVWRGGGARRGLTEVRDSGDGVPAPGWTVPWWPDVRALALEAAAAFAPVAAIGWDVAMTPAGALLIEANARWDPVPLPGARALVDALRAAG
ncbi:MAG TPA: sugar-transfer associated ATP-grasp domain-containing protein, partial [Miltoncostaeaceae bacterium]|nr:sugar-transfer associated ATP-grasp domain-containing protein [Miltoncostaeaceae bacterium]